MNVTRYRLTSRLSEKEIEGLAVYISRVVLHKLGSVAAIGAVFMLILILLAQPRWIFGGEDVVVVEDPTTGYQYLTSPQGGITPRIGTDGRHMRVTPPL